MYSWTDCIILGQLTWQYPSDPNRKFEATMTECGKQTMEAFYYGNMAELMGLSE